VVLGLVFFLLLVSHITVYALEVNVVRIERLWPRSFFGDDAIAGDGR